MEEKTLMTTGEVISALIASEQRIEEIYRRSGYPMRNEL